MSKILTSLSNIPKLFKNKKSTQRGWFCFDLSRARLLVGRSLHSLSEEREKVPGTGEVDRRRSDVVVARPQAVGCISNEA